MPAKESRQGHAVILTALPVEYEAVRAHLKGLQEETHKGTVYERGSFVAGSWQWEVGIVQIGAGNTAAAFEAERAIAYFEPGIVLFVGVAGGIKDVALGDVVAATRVYGYESGKAQQSQFLVKPDVGESSYRLVQRAGAEGRKKDWLQRIRGRKQTLPSPPRVFIGPIAAGEKVVASSLSDIYTFLRSNYNDAFAVEMEGRGFLHATHGNEQVQALIIRGISDLIDGKSHVDALGSQAIAACNSSAFAFEILARLDGAEMRQSVQAVNVLPQIFKHQSEVAKRTQTSANVSQQKVPPEAEAKEDLRLVDVHIHETAYAPVLDITLRNVGTQVAIPTRVRIDVLDVGKFYYCTEDIDTPRAVLNVTSNYPVELSPDLKGKSKQIKISHLLNPNDADRFQLTIDQDIQDSDPPLAYVWYYLKITIIYNEQAHNLESGPILISLPPVGMPLNTVWGSTDNIACAEQNRITLRRMARLAAHATKSDSVENAILQVLKA